MTDEKREMTFAELLEATEINVGSDLKVGDKIQGRIIAVGKDQVFVDTGSKIDGVIDAQDLQDAEGNFLYQEGDSVELFVVSRRNNEIKLGRSMGAEGGLEELEQAMQGQIPVQGKIQETCKGGFRVRVMGKTAFCPGSQIDLRPVDDPEALVGESFEFLISRVEERGRNIVVSRRALLEKERAESLQSLREKAAPGDILQGTVTRLAPFGAFVQLAPGLEGLIHISELSWSRNISPEEILVPGQEVAVKLLSVEEQENGQVRLQLSLKQTQQDPWEQVAATFQAGNLITGTVTRTVPFGAFVEIMPGVEGLVHISEMSYRKRVHKPEDEVATGDSVPVVIKEIDQQAKRISLSMRDAEGDPWEGIAERYAEGQVLQGKVEKREDFGLFIQLEPGVTGLMPKSKLNRAPGHVPEVSWDKLKPGDTVPVEIESIDPENRRMTLAPADSARTEPWQDYVPQGGRLGSLGEKLQQAMRKKSGQ